MFASKESSQNGVRSGVLKYSARTEATVVDIWSALKTRDNSVRDHIVFTVGPTRAYLKLRVWGLRLMTNWTRTCVIMELGSLDINASSRL